MHQFLQKKQLTQKLTWLIRTKGPCGGFLTTYKNSCPSHAVQEQTRRLRGVVRGMDTRGSTVFHADDFGLLDFRSSAPLVTALHWNRHFNKFIARDTRVHAAVLESLALLALRNTTIEVLVLARYVFWVSLFCLHPLHAMRYIM